MLEESRSLIGREASRYVEPERIEPNGAVASIRNRRADHLAAIE
jgi:hypothetical protein